MKHLKLYEETFPVPTEEELEKYDIKVGNYVIANENFFNSIRNPYFINELITKEIGKVDKIFISNKGYRNEQVYCSVRYTNIPESILKHISNKPATFIHSIRIDDLRKVSPEEFEKYQLSKVANKYNL